MRTIAIVNQKGGCGKTTTAINLAAQYAKRGLRTLLVDMDPQSHCAAGLGVPESRIEYSVGDALLADPAAPFDPSQLVWEVSRNLHLAPSTVMLSALEAPGGGLHALPDKDRRLEHLLARLADHYDRCLIDCPPTIGLLTFNALRAAREALIPVETGFFSLRGAEKQWATIQRMIAHIGRPIACHLLPTLHNPQSQLACNILAALRRQFAGQIIPVVIHEDEALREAASYGQPVLEYAPHSGAQRDFEALADWIEEHALQANVEIEILANQPGHGTGESPATAPMGSPMASQVDASHHDGRTISTGSRAAELVRRVHERVHRSTEKSAESPVAVNQPAPPVADWKPIVLREIADVIANGNDSSPQPTEVLPSVNETGTPNAATFAPSLPLRAFADEPEIAPPDFSHLYGVRQTSRGMLFVQPAPSKARPRSIAIAGEFNQWSPLSHPLRFDEHAGVFQTIIELPPGQYQYRLVVDGEWIADPHNELQDLNSYGEPNSLIVVRSPESRT